MNIKFFVAVRAKHFRNQSLYFETVQDKYACEVIEALFIFVDPSKHKIDCSYCR